MMVPVNKIKELYREEPEKEENDVGSTQTIQRRAESQDALEAIKGQRIANEIRISWDGQGRALDNIFVQWLWRSVKYEEVYIKDYQSVPQATRELLAYFDFYNHQRFHQSLDYQTPAAVYGNENGNRKTFISFWYFGYILPARLAKNRI